MARRLDKVSITLGKILQARGLGNRLSEYRIFGQWKRSIGPVIAQHAQPLSLHGKKLTLVVDSPAWMQQLSLLKPEIISKVNSTMGKEVVREITLKLGEVESRIEMTEAPSVLPVLDKEDREKIEHYLRGINDTDTREMIRRVIEKDFLNRKKKEKTRG